MNPTDPTNVIAVWQQDRWSNGGARGLLTGVSNDRGATWTTTFPHFSTCAGGTDADQGRINSSPATVPRRGIGHQSREDA